MAPIIPTHRPIVTPERAAIGVALVALACSLFLVFSTVARAQTPVASSPSACVERVAGVAAAPGVADAR